MLAKFQINYKIRMSNVENYKSICSEYQKEVKMKKLALMIIIVAMIMVSSVALAQGNGWDDFEGTYRMVGSGSCIHSQNGYYDVAANGWITAKPGVVYAGTTVLDGFWYFNNDGTGKYSQTLYATVTPPPSVPPPAKGPPVEVAGGIRVFTANNVPFTYEIANGDIKVIAGGIELKGSISADLTTMTLVSANNVPSTGSPAPFWYTICNIGRTLIKIKD